jgi:hypothetical protein
VIAPAGANAHGRSPTVAIDYRLTLGPAPAGLVLHILDGDRSLEARVASGATLLVRGLLREPMLRIDNRGVFANAASPTAQADKVVGAGTGWQRVASGRAYAWHEHRLTPTGAAGSFRIPVVVNGKDAVIAGTYVRVPRPPLWPWLAGGAALLAGIGLASARRRLQLPLTIGSGVVAGLAALAAVIAFAFRDRPGGGIGWLPIGACVAVGLALGVPLLRLHGRRRAHAAGVAGAVAAAATISSLPVFWHGVVISALPADVARLACGFALLGGVAAATLSLLPEFDG